MKRLKKETGELWGQSSEFHPYLIEWVHGDGKQIISFQYMDDRPCHYVVRIDSGVDIEDNDNFCDDVEQELMSAIRDESIEFMSKEQIAEFDEHGYFVECDRDWPIPPLEGPCGWSWGALESFDIEEVVD